MRIWQIVAGTLALGLFVGVGLGLYQSRTVDEDILGGLRPRGQKSHQGPASAKEKQPRVEVDDPIHDFGVMDVLADGTHDFVFTNVGDAVLTLSDGGSTCACTVGELKQSHLAPGESTVVTVHFQAHAPTDFGPYEETATIVTNDPDRPRMVLTVRGEFRAALQPEPREVVFSRVRAGEPATATVRIDRFLPEPVQITEVGLQDPQTVEFFDVEIEEMPAELAVEQEGSFGGHLIHLTLNPGMSLGTFQQRLRLRTSLDDGRELEIPVKGTIAGDISVVGRDWNDDLGVLMMGMVDSAAGARRTLNLVVRGPTHDSITFDVKEVDPEILSVTFGEPRRLGQASITQIPVTIAVPAGSRGVSRLGTEVDPLGRVLLKTSHPDAPELLIRVRFAVAG